MHIERIDPDRGWVNKGRLYGDGGGVWQRFAADTYLFAHEGFHNRVCRPRHVRSAVHFHLAANTLMLLLQRLHEVIVVPIRTAAQCDRNEDIGGQKHHRKTAMPG